MTKRASELIKVTVEHGGRNYDIWKDSTDGAPRAKDLDVARWLGYQRERDIRQLITRYSDEMGEVSRHRTAKPSSLGGRPEEGYLLTEAQALFLAAKSETPTATAVLKTMIAVFQAVQRGAFSDRGPNRTHLPVAEVADLLHEEREGKRDLCERVAALEARLVTRAGALVGEEVKRDLTNRAKSMADLQFRKDTGKLARRQTVTWQSIYADVLRKAAFHAHGLGVDWRFMTAAQADLVAQFLAQGTKDLNSRIKRNERRRLKSATMPKGSQLKLVV